MRVRLLAVGRGDKRLAEYVERQAGRIRPFAEFGVVEIPEGRGKPNQRRAEEARRILDRAEPGFILFDERGRTVSSAAWADHFDRLSGGARVDFVIGGADGVDESVRRKAGACWSLSALTLPHQLVRAVACEQIYRAFTILAGHPYHRA